MKAKIISKSAKIFEFLIVEILKNFCILIKTLVLIRNFLNTLWEFTPIISIGNVSLEFNFWAYSKL